MPNYDKLTPKEALQQWKAHCETVQEATTVDAHETDAQKKQRIKRLLSDYGAFVDYYFPHYTTNPQTGRQTPCAPFHLKAAKQIISDRNVKAVFKWHRGAAKSTHLDIFIPMWLKAQIYGGAELRQFWVMVLVGKSQDNANTLLADLQAELQYNKRYAADFGEQYNNGTWEEGSFVTKTVQPFSPVVVDSRPVVFVIAPTVLTTLSLTTWTMTSFAKTQPVCHASRIGLKKLFSVLWMVAVAASSWWATS